MKSKPFSRRDKSEYIDTDPNAENYLSKTVFEPDPLWTGLYDHQERKIFRTMPQIGFIRFDSDKEK